MIFKTRFRICNRTFMKSGTQDTTNRPDGHGRSLQVRHGFLLKCSQFLTEFIDRYRLDLICPITDRISIFYSNTIWLQSLHHKPIFNLILLNSKIYKRVCSDSVLPIFFIGPHQNLSFIFALQLTMGYHPGNTRKSLPCLSSKPYNQPRILTSLSSQ